MSQLNINSEAWGLKTGSESQPRPSIYGYLFFEGRGVARDSSGIKTSLSLHSATIPLVDTGTDRRYF